jgi:hypothetical protein
VPAGGLCGGKPCWKALPGRGHRYKDRDRTPDGLLKVLLKTSAGDATLKVKGKGARLPAVSLPFTQDPAVTVQLVGADACWQTRHEPPAKRNHAARFIDVTAP